MLGRFYPLGSARLTPREGSAAAAAARLGCWLGRET